MQSLASGVINSHRHTDPRDLSSTPPFSPARAIIRPPPDIRRHRPTGAIRAAFRRRRGAKSGPGRTNTVPAVRNATARCCAGQSPGEYAVGEQIALALACGRVFELRSPCAFGHVWGPPRFSPRFS